MDFNTIKEEFMNAAKAAQMLQVAYVGVANKLFDCLLQNGELSVAELAGKSAKDSGYINVWCDAAYAFGLLEWNGKFSLSDKGKFLARQQETIMQIPAQAMVSAHMMERAATLMKTGERPGEKVLLERESILPMFGEMLERSFAGFFAGTILPQIPAYEEINAQKGLVVDLGCGNGWYLRKIAERFRDIRCLGLDGFHENIKNAAILAKEQGVGDRVSFAEGDIYSFKPAEKADLVAMNRALHHVWDKKEKVFEILAATVKPGGYAVIWEPHWPKDKEMLRKPEWKGMAMQNITEYVQGNHFLNPEEIEAQLAQAGFKPKTFLFANGAESLVTGKRT